MSRRSPNSRRAGRTPNHSDPVRDRQQVLLWFALMGTLVLVLVGCLNSRPDERRTRPRPEPPAELEQPSPERGPDPFLPLPLNDPLKRAPMDQALPSRKSHWRPTEE